MAHREAAETETGARARLAAKEKELEVQVRLTKQRAEESAAAEVREAALEGALEASRAWLVEFVASLHIPDKEQALEAATKEENRKVKKEEAAARYADWQK